MKIEASRPQKIGKQLEGEPIRIGRHSLQPRARLSGFVGFGGDKNGGGGGLLRLKPQDVIVRTGDGPEQHLMLADPTAAALRGMATVGIALAALAWLMMNLARILRFRQSTGK